MRRLIIPAISVAALFGVPAAHAALDLTLGSPNNPNVPKNTSGPKNFEGVWLPQSAQAGGPGGGMGAGGPPGGGAGGPPGGGAGGPPGEGGPGGAGGPPGGGAGGPPGGGGGSDGNSRLECKPQMHLSGGGGGSTVLVVQSDKQMILAGEELSYTFQWIYINGKHPEKVTPQPNGHSIAHWEGNTLVVDSIGYSDSSGKDSGKHIVERFSKNGDTLNIAVTTTTKDGKATTSNDTWKWRPDLQINESICEEDFDRYEIVNGVTESGNTRKE